MCPFLTLIWWIRSFFLGCTWFSQLANPGGQLLLTMLPLYVWFSIWLLISPLIPPDLKSPKMDVFSAVLLSLFQYTYMQYEPYNQSFTLWTNRGTFVWYLKCGLHRDIQLWHDFIFIPPNRLMPVSRNTTLEASVEVQTKRLGWVLDFLELSGSCTDISVKRVLGIL